ncbi:MAG: hypothetical protein HYS09_00070 [Chloroflexi bacterium]|nr:hypothetical protein [Chloroflexota bacterium]
MQNEVSVQFADQDPSGFASIIHQYLTQSLDDSPRKRRQALRLRGRVAVEASDQNAAVTMEFAGPVITLTNGEEPPVDARISAPYLILSRLLEGRANLLVEHLRSRLRVRARPSRLLLPLHVHNLMKLPPARER